MNTLWNKVWSDLWLSKGRTLLAILSISTGVFCIGTLLGMIDLQLSKMDAAHRAARPSHISLILRTEAESHLLKGIAAIPEIAGTDTMTPLSIQFRIGGETEWQTGTLIFRPEPKHQRYDLTTLTSGDWPSGNGIAIEQMSAQFAGISPGHVVEINTPKVSENLQVTGIVRHPFVKPPRFGGQIHFFANFALAERFGLKTDGFRQLMVQVTTPYSEDKARDTAKAIREFLIRQGTGVSVTLLQDPEKHWGRPLLAGIDHVLQLMAFASLFLACVLIFNTIAAHISQQTNQIGIMKSLGAAKATIVQLYLLETALIAGIAVLLALAPALAAAHFSACALLGLFNIECSRFDVSPRALAIMVTGGLVAPMFAALWPILRGATMNVREALSSYGLGSDFGGNAIDRWVERFSERFLSTLNATALGNLFRRKGRLLLTQSVLVIAGVIFLVLMSLIASVNQTLDNEMARSRYSVRLGFTQDQPISAITPLMTTAPGTQSIEFWQRLPLEISIQRNALKQKGSLGLQMLALPAASTMYRPYVESGRWLKPEDRGHRVIVISADTANMNDIKAGDKLFVQIGPSKEIWQVVGLYRWLAGGNFTVEPVYAPIETVQAIIGQRDYATFAMISTGINSAKEETDYLGRLKQRFQEQNIGLDVFTTAAKLEQRQFTRNQFNSVVGTLSGLAALIAAVGGIGLSGTLAIGVLQRTREIGVLRAIGAPSRKILQLFLLEGFWHGLLAWVLSIPLASIAAPPVAGKLGEILFGIRLDFVFDFRAIAYWLAVMLCLAGLAAYWPAKTAARMTVRDALDHF